MPYAIRILRKGDRGPEYDFGEVAEPLFTFSNRHYPELIGLLQIDQSPDAHLFSVGATWLYYDNYSNAYAFRQVLNTHIPPSWHEPLYLFGALVRETPKVVTAHFGATSEQNQQIKLAFLPRMENDIIQINDKCYRCKQVIFRKGEVVVQVDPTQIEVAEIEHEFYGV